jgi:nitrogen fixation-related uncharacterized protein
MTAAMGPNNLSLEQLNAIVSGAVGAYTRRVWWARKKDVIDDLRQEAWAVLYQARTTWDENVGVPFAAYAHKAIILSLRRVLWMLSSPASASRNKLGELASAHHAPLPTEDWWTHPEQLVQRDNWADQLLDDARWQARAREALEDLAEGDEQIALGVDSLVTDEKPREYAARSGVPAERVHRARTKAKERIIGDIDLYRLAKERGT